MKDRINRNKKRNISGTWAKNWKEKQLASIIKEKTRKEADYFTDSINLIIKSLLNNIFLDL